MWGEEGGGGAFQSLNYYSVQSAWAYIRPHEGKGVLHNV